jgi:cell division protein FtsL
MVKPNRKTTGGRKMTGTWLVLLAVFIGELLFYTWCRVGCVRIGYEITTASKAVENGARLQNSLRIELASLKSPKRIADIAGRRLGLIMPSAEQTIVIP